MIPLLIAVIILALLTVLLGWKLVSARRENQFNYNEARHHENKHVEACDTIEELKNEATTVRYEQVEVVKHFSKEIEELKTQRDEVTSTLEKILVLDLKDYRAPIKMEAEIGRNGIHYVFRYDQPTKYPDPIDNVTPIVETSEATS